MPELNIITSSSNWLAKYIFTQLRNISENLLPKYKVHFWLFHYRIEKSDIAALKSYSAHLGIEFNEIYVADYADYQKLCDIIKTEWVPEAFFYFWAHKYLPENLDRALYIDASDIIFDGDIEEFYFAPFDGNFVITSMAFSSQLTTYKREDLSKPLIGPHITNEYVNSGSMVLNIAAFRYADLCFPFYKKIAEYVMAVVPEYTWAVGDKKIIRCNADQGLFAAAFLEKIKFWGYEEYGYESLYMPYNFRPFVLEWTKEKLGIPDGANIDLGYEPHIIHLLGNKPWKTDKAKYETLLPVSRKYLDMFWEAERGVKEDLKKLGIKIPE
jgi:lipopolysaccharide biosynthesis glycosyltransferase